ncbi:MAG: hypothetical protein Q8S73_08035 [Deltaproteobacteria bacterium]|nr:hypothetical protein [Myxococcales bacterium]MDP3214037.1 hypothetical protein [Deltaproteobacteria bacterium]
MTHEEIVKGLLERIKHAVETDRLEDEIAKTVSLIDTQLARAADEKMHAEFWKALLNREAGE